LIVQYIAGSIALLVAINTAGYWLTRSLCGAQTPAIMGLAAAAALTASFCGAVPIALARKRTAPIAGFAVLAATGMRFFVAIVLALVLAVGTAFPKAPMLVWLVIDYLLLLIPDSLLAIWAGSVEKQVC